jgi:hypothetical protein
VTPEERSREYAPGEWDVPSEIRVLLLVPEVEPENWPVLPEDETRLTRGLATARDWTLLLLVVVVVYGLIFGLTWGAWKVFS